MKLLHLYYVIHILAFAGFAFIFSALLIPEWTAFLKRQGIVKQIRETAVTGEAATIFNELHGHKAGTPSMGGAIVILSVLSTTALSHILYLLDITDMTLLSRGETYLPLFTMLSVGVLGLVDDYLNVKSYGSQKGLAASIKWWSLVLFAVLGALWFSFKLSWSLLTIPFFGVIDIGLWYFPLFIIITIGTSHAVNITDGLDGLSGGTLAIAFSVFGAIAYIHDLPLLSALCAMIVAALVGFLWYNVPPASIFIGDTGALGLGATLGVIAMLTDSVFVLPIIGMIFVIEIMSSFLQIFWKKVFKKKLFIVAPIHHTFEKIGWSETKITMRFWIISAICGALGLIISIYLTVL